ncbi:MAG: type II 3-dehydroquinate dehydratase [Christensenellales bacterium]
MKITVINGANLDMLGIREKQLYGEKSYKSLVKFCKEEGKKRGIKIECFQSNSEGKIIDKIHACYGKSDGIIINAGGYTHTSVAILDALKAVAVLTVEVHITDINAREGYRKVSYISEYAAKTICGHGFDGYAEAMDFIRESKK